MTYHRPHTLQELQHMLSEYGNNMHLLAGGTDLLVEARRSYFVAKGHIVDIFRLSELKTLSEDADKLVLGAGLTHDDIAHHPLIQKFASLLSAACSQIGSQQIRNRGTIGGNLCNASPCADTVPPLMALDAELELLSATGSRLVPVRQFFEKPYRPRLAENEVIMALHFKKLSAQQKSAFYKLGRRNAAAISRIDMAVVLKTNAQKRIEEVRIAPGSVFPVWQRVAQAEEYLLGKEANQAHFKKAGEIVARRMIEISGRRWSTPYKEPVVAALTKRTLMMALTQKKSSDT